MSVVSNFISRYGVCFGLGAEQFFNRPSVVSQTGGLGRSLAVCLVLVDEIVMRHKQRRRV